MGANPDTVTASFQPASVVHTIIVPDWILNPTVIPRKDGLDEVTIEVTRQFRQERWLIIAIENRPGVICAFRLLGAGEIPCPEQDIHLVVRVPLDIYPDFKVQRYKPSQSS